MKIIWILSVEICREILLKKIIYYSKILGLKKGRKLKGSYNINFGKEINTSNDFNYNRIEIYFY